MKGRFVTTRFTKPLLIGLLAGLICCFTSHCSKDTGVGPEDSPQYDRGDLIDSEATGFYTPFLIEGLLTALEADLPFELNLSVRSVSITYQTVNARGEATVASGAILIPVGRANLPLLSIQHGTETYRQNVASVNPARSPEGAMGVVAGSLGYLACVADYPGLGVSKGIHPYVHAKSLAVCGVDFLRACREYCSEQGITLNGQTFLTGYSEGGYATLALQKEIESEYAAEFNLTAVAPCAGPYDLYGMMMTILQSVDYGNPAYVAYILTAYDDIYGWDRLDDFFITPYASMMGSLFDGSKTYVEVVSALPSTLSELLDSTFVADVLAGNEPEVASAFQENTLLDFAPVAPVHFFHGDADQTVFYQNALTAMDSLTVMGGTDLRLTTIPGGTHNTASLPSIIGVVDWFDGFRSTMLAVDAPPFQVTLMRE